MATGRDANSEGHPRPAVRWHLVLAAGRRQQGHSKDHKQTNDMQPLGSQSLLRTQGEGISKLNNSMATLWLTPSSLSRERHSYSPGDGETMGSAYTKDKGMYVG